MRKFYVYIMASHSRVLYVGVTNDLKRRVYQHRTLGGSQFAGRYELTLLVYFEETANVAAAIAREKQIKCWRRERKMRLIQAQNPEWRDLSIDWFRDVAPSQAIGSS